MITKKSFILAVSVICLTLAVAMPGYCSESVTEGTLKAVTKDAKELGEFPLKSTEVKATISGYIARVDVTQTFTNPYKEAIEAVYVFPLPQNAAVDDMTIKVGTRTIKGQIKKREEARQIYEKAKQAGHMAALLEQERPNIFTQSVANIVPGDSIEVKISYIEVLEYDNGSFDYVFPMVVGPRFIPGSPTGTSSDGGWAPNTDKVPDASRITPPVLKPGERSGHDINVSVTINAGVDISEVTSPSHKISVSRTDRNKAEIKLQPQDTIPNKDFTLRYKVAGEAPQYGLLTHKTGTQGYFLLHIQPKAHYNKSEITPKEMVFVIDSSGSMNGYPIEKAKEAVRRFLKELNPDDTFQIIKFSDTVSTFSPMAVENTPENIMRASSYIDTPFGGGGTMMLNGIIAALDRPADPKRIRIVAFLTDGYIGNELEILAAIQKKLNSARFCSFGVGTSVNRYLLDGMADAGRGFVQYVRPDEDTYTVVEKFYRRINNPCLTDIEIDYRGVKVIDVYPKTIPDLFDSQPLFIYGKYTNAWKGKITLRGKMAGRPVAVDIDADFPAKSDENGVIATIWARAKIKELSSQMHGGTRPDIVQEITDIALTYRLMSQYTSFVAVEETVVVEGGVPKKVMVPVEIPDQVSYEGIFGQSGNGVIMNSYAATYSVGGGMPRMALAKCAEASADYCAAGRATDASLPLQLKWPHVGPESRWPVPAVKAKINAFKITITDKTKNITTEIGSDGYVFRTAGDGVRKLVKKLGVPELDQLKDLLAKCDLSALNNKTFASSDKLEVSISVDSQSATISLDSHASKLVQPATFTALQAYLTQLSI